MTMPTAESDSTASLDSVISAVADEHRRAVLRILNRSEGEAISLDTLAEGVAEQVDSGDLSDEEHRHQIRITLHQIHLPKLKSYGMVRYDIENKEAQSSIGDLSQELLAVIESYETTE